MSTLAWSHRAAEIREAKTFTKAASADELEKMSARIGNATCLELAARYTVRPKAGGRFVVEGRVTARLEQTCGLTLDVMYQEIDEPVDVVFEEGPGRGEPELEVGFDPLADDPPEAIVNGRIGVGEIISEIVALAADPFPRSAESELEQWEAGGEAEPAETDENPFAKLKALSPGGERKDD